MKLATNMLAIGALLLSLTACSQAEGEKPGVGDKLVDVPLTTLDGKKTTLDKLVKGRVALIKFGATWCPPCKVQMKEFEKVIDAYGDKVTLLDIDLREPASKVKAYHKRNKFRTPTVLDPKGEAAQKYNVQGIPTVFITSHTGQILFRAYTTPFAGLKPILDKAIEAAAKAKGSKAAGAGGK